MAELGFARGAATAFAALETPAAVVDCDRVQKNLVRMQGTADRLGVRLRPHVKTHKCREVARAQAALGAHGITVSTLKEADYFFAHGFDDVLYAVGITPNKFAHTLRLRRAGCKLTVITDDGATASSLARFGREHGECFDVMLEIDTDGKRAGLPPDDPRLLEVAARLDGAGARLCGVMTHAGGSYALHDPQALRACAEQERSLCVAAAQRLRAAGHACRDVSVGSTPTALSAGSLAGVTELRAGVYVFFDLVIAGIGVCTRQELALSVLTSVIGHQPDKNWVLVDAGWMAMSRDRGTQGQSHDWGYGAVCAADSGEWLADLRFTQANQEHGILEALGDCDVRARFPVGTLLRVFPNHACATAAQFPSYVVQRDGIVQAERWERVHGW
jgi:D-serine deaminase-like pyridoxal phosphate-dependent protein